MTGTGGRAKNKETTRETYARLHDNIKIDFREVGWNDINCINLAQDRDQ
jgi:hypothetical protein